MTPFQFVWLAVFGGLYVLACLLAALWAIDMYRTKKAVLAFGDSE